MKVMPVVLTLLLIVIPRALPQQIANGDTIISSKAVNTWVWTPSGSSPTQYLVEKSTDGGQTWTSLAIADATNVVEINQIIYVAYDITSAMVYLLVPDLLCLRPSKFDCAQALLWYCSNQVHKGST